MSIFIRLKIFAAFLLLSNYGLAQVVVRHEGAKDPELQGFSLASVGYPLVGGVMGQDGYDAWFTQSRTTSEFISYRYFFGGDESESAMQLGFSISAKARFAELSDDSKMLLMLRTDGKRFYLWLTATTAGNLLIGGDGLAPFTYEVDPFSYHDYALVYEAASHTAAFWINGSPIATLGGFSHTSPTPVLAQFGNSAESITHTYWHQVTVAIIPEPAAVAFWGGLGALLSVFGMRRFRAGRASTSC